MAILAVLSGLWLGPAIACAPAPSCWIEEGERDPDYLRTICQRYVNRHATLPGIASQLDNPAEVWELDRACQKLGIFIPSAEHQARKTVDAWIASPEGQEATAQARKDQAAQDAAQAQARSETPARPTIIATFKGTCTAKLFAGWFPCDPHVGYMVLPNGRSVAQFEAKGQQFVFAGGHDRQPDINDLFLTVDRLRIMQGSKQIAVDDRMEGECHFVFNDDASEFKFVHCDAWDRAKGLTFFFHLDDIIETNHKTF